MAFNIDPSISLGVKGQQAMSLNDMMNLATSAQEYKKNQVLNPLIQDIYKSKSELSRYDVLNTHFDNIIKNSADLQLDPDLNKASSASGRILEGPLPNRPSLGFKLSGILISLMAQSLRVEAC